jgi:hypothetical protein
MPPKIWVPQPATKLYSVGGTDAETVRDRFVRQHGESSVQRAELSVVLDLMMLTGMIKPSEFIEVISKKLSRLEQQRQAAAGFQG